MPGRVFEPGDRAWAETEIVSDDPSLVRLHVGQVVVLHPDAPSPEFLDGGIDVVHREVEPVCFGAV